MMTEDEAKTKFCPINAIQQAIIVTTHTCEQDMSRCDASECMWWAGDGCGIVRTPGPIFAREEK